MHKPKTYNYYINGKLAATYEDTPVLPRKKQTFTERLQAAKRARRDARLVQILASY